MKRVPQWMQGSKQQGAPASPHQGAPVNHVHPNHPFSPQVGTLADWFMGQVPDWVKNGNQQMMPALPQQGAPVNHVNPAHPFYPQVGQLALWFMDQVPQWVKDADRQMMPAPPPPRAPVAQADPLILMNEIDRLQNIVRDLKSRRDAGRPAPDETSQISYARNGLQAHLKMCRDQQSFDGAPIAEEHLDFLRSYTNNAIADLESVASSMGHAPAGKTPLDALPAHVDLLESHEKESFGESFAILNSILQDKNRPLSAENAATLKKAASTLERLNSLCERRLAAQVSEVEPDNPASLQSRYHDIDKFQSALERAVREAIGNETPPHGRVPEGRTGDESFDQSLDEIRKLLDKGKTRELNAGEEEVIEEHFDNLVARIETFDSALKAIANDAKETIHTEIGDYRAAQAMEHVPEFMHAKGLPPPGSSSSLQNPHRVTASQEREDEDDLYTATPLLPSRYLEGTQTRNFGRRSTGGMQSFAAPSIPEMKGPDSRSSFSAAPRRSPFPTSFRDTQQVNAPPLSKESFQAARSIHRRGKFGRSSVNVAATISSISEPVQPETSQRRPERPGRTGNTTGIFPSRVGARPSTSAQKIGKTDGEPQGPFSLLRQQEMMTPPPMSTRDGIEAWTSSVHESLYGDLRRTPSILSEPVTRDLPSRAEESQPDRPRSSVGNPLAFSWSKEEAALIDLDGDPDSASVPRKWRRR